MQADRPAQKVFVIMNGCMDVEFYRDMSALPSLSRGITSVTV